MGLTSDAGRYLFIGSGVRELFLIKRRWEDQSLGVAVSMWLPLEFQVNSPRWVTDIICCATVSSKQAF